jgi:hypothetical protein
MMTYFPGALLLKGLSPREPLSPIVMLTAIFGLSLGVNLVLVIALVAFHLYTTPVVRGLGLIELLACLWCYRNALCRSVNLLAGLQGTPAPIDETPFAREHRGLHIIAFLLLLGACINWVGSWGNVFGPWDPTVSYNRWALDFSQNHLPILTWHYPQLLPANWSLAYVAVGYPFEMFPASIQGLFLVFTLLLFWEGFQVAKDRGYLLGLVIFVTLIFLEYFAYINSGYADIPVGFFNFAAIFFVLQGRSNSLFFQRLALFFAFAAAMTKPGGIYTAVMIPLLLYVLNKQSLRQLMLRYLLLGLVIAPWYLYASYAEVGTAHPLSEVHYLLTLHGNDLKGWALIVNTAFKAIIALGMLSLVFKRRRTLEHSLHWAFLLSLPYFGIWFVGFGYDARNLLLWWPLFCLSAGSIGMKGDYLFYKAQSWKVYFEQVPLGWLLLGLCVVVLQVNLYGSYTKSAMIHTQSELKNSTFDPTAMLHLFSYKTSPGFQGEILANSQYYQYIPLLQPWLVPLPLASFGPDMVSNLFNDPAALKAFLLSHPNIHYLLISHKYDDLMLSKVVMQQLQAWVNAKKISLVFVTTSPQKAALYTINVRNDALYLNT